ncbi:MAG: hypothetical protein SPLUMA2_SPLUMAMAG2_01057 [uncultured Sulfurimonas sp.]|nr:MAG: hypothetical protein SPLUMA1_SPLUMAMAG1_01830 [uncultured Sulfurimonas sp.]CAI6162607.1 MAG: hypothetical protein SPLUMA2_SPLUMAMAG2_01057 [uncultured Sulfurimonas sp.]
MSYDVRGELLGFPDTHTVTITEIDSLFSTLKDTNNENKKLAQIVLEPKKHLDFGMTETIKSLKD